MLAVVTPEGISGVAAVFNAALYVRIVQRITVLETRMKMWKEKEDEDEI